MRKAFVPRHAASAGILLAGLLSTGCQQAAAPSTPQVTKTPAPTKATTSDAQDAIDASTSAVLQGDSGAALGALRAVPAARFAPEDAGYRACMLERFGGAQPPASTASVQDEWVNRVLAVYQRYWWQALAVPGKRALLDSALARKVRTLLGADAPAGDMEALETALTAELRRRGFHAQLGRTPPLHELMLWRTQATKRYRVELPEGPQSVDVDLMDDFVSRGWSSYARCERGSAGGWATADKLYAVVPSYAKDGGLGSEMFRVVFLGHEAQHFADQNRWPEMPSWELEYRAKLVELAQAQTVSARRLRSFITAQGDDLDSPHTYANKRVVAALTARLGRAPDQVPITALQAAARAELLADTARR